MNVIRLIFCSLIVFLFLLVVDLSDYLTIYTVIFISIVFGMALCMYWSLYKKYQRNIK